jgi:nuclear pore complex protein Nup93
METDGGFSDLLQQAQQLKANMDTGEALPRVERNLVQIRETAAKLAYRTPYSALESSDVKASLLLSARGYDVQKVIPKLESLSAAKTFEPLEAVRDTDIQGFLKNERENALLAVIEQTRKNTFDDTTRRHWDSMECEWEREKQKILTSLVDSAGETLEFIQESDSMLTDSLALHGRSTMDSTELLYARQVYAFNDAIIQGGVRPSLVNLLLDVASRQDNININELWNVVRHMTDIPPFSANDLIRARTSPAMQAAFVRQALKYLQQSYVKYIEMKVYSNLHQAQRGGIPGTYNLVRSFLNIQQTSAIPRDFEDGRVDGLPTWSMIYHCMRCGDLQAASDVISKARQHLGDFPQFFQEYANSESRRLTAQSERDLRLQYHRSIRNSTDPYKRAVYCCIGRCDARDDHSEVATSTDDYLWLKLGQVTFDDVADGSTRDRLTLTQLQTMLLEDFGETHFAAYQQPFLYFRVLFLTAQFEAAVEFLARLDSLRCYSVHVALILYDMKLLLLPTSTHALLLSKDTNDPAPLRRLNFVRLILMYTRKFEVSDPREALQYFYFLRDLTTPAGENLFKSCVSELVLETREFDMLLGVLQTDGSRRPGALDKFRMDTQAIIEFVAHCTENKGQFEDAVRLYDLAQDHEKVVELLNKLLSQVISQPPAPQSNRDRLKQLSLAIAQRYRALNIEVSRTASTTFYLQLDLMTFFDLYHSGNHERAYSVMQDLKILPLAEETVEQKVALFRSYSDEIRRSLPDVLLAMMTLLLNQYRSRSTTGLQSPVVSCPSPSQSMLEDSTRQTMINQLRKQAKALIVFAGLIPYRLPGDTNARLVQMEVLMH